MDRPARLFLCARCRSQVVLCSHCDHGQRYCTRVCSRLARSRARHEAARRYQHSRGGRMAHAARAQRWRTRQLRIEPGVSAAPANKVTHQGSQAEPADALLDACTPELAASSTACATAQAATLTAPLTVEPGPAPGRCRRCGAALLPWVRQSFLRPPVRTLRLPRHDHSP